MRIGFDITTLYVATAGVFWQNFNLVKALLAVDHDDEFLLLDYYPIHGGWLKRPEVATLTSPNSTMVHSRGFRHYRLSRWQPVQRPFLKDVAAAVDRLLYKPLSLVATRVMCSKLESVLAGVEVFHSSDVLLWRQPGAVNICTLHDLTPLLFPELHTAENQELHKKKFRFAQERADVIIAVSEATKRDIVTHLGIAPERVQVVYNGVSSEFHPIEDHAYLEEVLRAQGLTPQGYLLYVGTIEPRKNLVRLVEAYARLCTLIPGPLPQLALVGPTGWCFKDVFATVKALGLEEAVKIVGQVPVEILPALYNGALLFVYPSLYEGFGLPPLEAMACGTPVVTSNVSSLPEVVGGAGVMVPPTDTLALAEALAALILDAERREALRQAGLTQASRFSWERAARQTLEVYHTALHPADPMVGLGA